MTDQPTLFNPDATGDQTCPVCAATKPAGTQHTPNCAHDRREGDYTPRPTGCLNAYDPQHADLPY